MTDVATLEKSATGTLQSVENEYGSKKYLSKKEIPLTAYLTSSLYLQEPYSSPSELSQYRAQNALIIPDRTPACIWQPGMIIDMTGYLPGDADDQRRPWMVLAVDWPYECVLACPLFTHQQTGLAHVRRDRRYMYMPLAFTSHTLQFVRTNQFRRVKRQWGYDLPWPDHDPTGFSRYHPAVVEHVYARSYLHATSMLAPRYAQVVPLQFVEMPLAVGRLAYHDFLRVLDHVWADTWWRPNAPAVPWL